MMLLIFLLFLPLSGSLSAVVIVVVAVVVVVVFGGPQLIGPNIVSKNGKKYTW